jgi:hemophore-related protein
VPGGLPTAGAAAADLVAPLAGSTCSFEQLDTTLHIVAPRTAHWLDTHPAQAEQFGRDYDSPHRDAALRSLYAEHPDIAPDLSEAQQAANTCHNY